MSNTHLKDMRLTLKAKGLLSMMLGFPEDWNYSITGLVAICKENETAIKSALEELKKNFGDLVYETIIPRNVRLAEAPSYGKPAMYYDKSSVGSKAYLALAAEIISKANK